MNEVSANRDSGTGALWAIFQQLIRQAFVAAFIFILARRVSPLEFGLIGIANIWNNFLTLFLELGFSSILVQRRQISSSLIAAGFIWNVVFGAGLMVLTMVLSGPVSVMMKAPEAQPVIFTVSISFLVTSILSTKLALAQREFRFKEIALRDCVAQSISAGVGILLAFAGFGVWSVVANSLLVNITLAVLIWNLSPSRIDLRNVTGAALREVWDFGSRVFGSSGLKYFFRSADSMLVGILFGPEKLGLYNFAQRITAAPTKAIQFGLASYLFPKASQVQDDSKALKEIFVLSFKALNYLLLTFSILLVTVGAGLLVKVFGAQWEPAIGLIRILILIQLLAPAIVPLSEILKAANRPDWLLRWSILTTALTLGGLYLGSRFGFVASGFALVASWWISIPIIAWMAQRLTGIRLNEFWGKTRLSYLLPASMGAILLTVYSVDIPLLSFCAIAFIVMSVMVLVMWRREGDLRELVRIVGKR